MRIPTIILLLVLCPFGIALPTSVADETSEAESPHGEKYAEKNGPLRLQNDPAKHWAFHPMSKVVVPAVRADDPTGWGSEIDRFILAQHRKLSLAPNPRADRRTLIRRLYFDVIGLPPTPQQITAFVEDETQQAYGKVVEQLLASPHFGERWARHWLDVARFAESEGFEHDYDRADAYHYRDFVIQALNADLPFDKFVKWQIAGDEFEPENPLALAATGFLVAGVFPTQLTEAEFESARYDQMDDMLATTGTAFLGLTIGCARCHDHKYDPISAQDYYNMLATFTSTIPGIIDVELTPPDLARQIAQWEVEQKKRDEAVSNYAATHLKDKVDQWIAKPTDPASNSTWVLIGDIDAKSQAGAQFTRLDDDSLLVQGANGASDVYTLTFKSTMPNIRALRLEAMTHASMRANGPGRASNGNFGLGEIRVMVAPAENPEDAKRVKLIRPRATHQQNTGNLSIAASLDESPNTGWAVDGGGIGKSHAAIFEFEQPIGNQSESVVTVELHFAVNGQHNLGRPRLSLSNHTGELGFEDAATPQALREAYQLAKAGDETKLTPSHRQAIANWIGLNDSQYTALAHAAQSHRESKPKPATTKMYVGSEGIALRTHHANGRGYPHHYPKTYFLDRGDVKQKVAEVSQGFLSIFNAADTEPVAYRGEVPENTSKSFRRRALAEWIMDTQDGTGELAARVIVNRLWQHLMGRGIVATPSDFGLQGELPTHPDLLDYLATQLIENDWSLKHIVRLILHSSVYQQADTFVATHAEIDRENRFYWRRTPRRLEGEIIRDAMLAVSGQLDRTQFGPGQRNPAMKRRSIYFFVKRSQIQPMMMLFGSPDALVGIADRPETTVAPQALMLMNSPIVRDYAKGLAAQAAGESTPDIEQVVHTAYQIALGRDPSEAEQTQAVAFIRQSEREYEETGEHPDAAKAAIVDFCQMLLSLNEFVYVH